MLLRRRYMVGGGEVPYEEQYLTFEALEAGTFTLTIPERIQTTKIASVSYSLDGGSTWTTIQNQDDTEVVITTPTISAGNKVLWKGLGAGNANSSNVYNNFSSTGLFNVYGNIYSYLLGDNFLTGSRSGLGTYTFSFLFRGCKVVNATNLILDNLETKNYMYYNLFYGCVNLTQTPKILPALSLAQNCYGSMFRGCVEITEAPILCATDVSGSQCCDSMFYGCTKLKIAPDLLADDLKGYMCYGNMFRSSGVEYVHLFATKITGTIPLFRWLQGVPATGTIVKKESLTLDSGNSGIPSSWTVIEEP